ncbi:hypothetical protein [Helicobacter rodentium]|uniref:hypothetical protein n=1 Tax=Helicobacter rodentium TaxID=59617 RepID=UPI0025A62BD9|nr:hypothetical protein [Helicobacter rodentium]
MLIPRNDRGIKRNDEKQTTASLRECVAFVAIHNLAYIKLYKTLQFQTFKIPL